MTSSKFAAEHEAARASSSYEQDRDDAFLVNEIAFAITLRTRHISNQDVATGLLAIHEDNHIVLPIFKECLSTYDSEEMRIEMIHAVIRSARDLLAVADYFVKQRGRLPRRTDNAMSGMGAAGWYPFNALSVIACWHLFRGAADSPISTSGYNLDSPLWDTMQSLCDNADPSDNSLPETLSWIAEHPSVVHIRGIVQERGLTSRHDIESVLESQGNVTGSNKNGVL
jgi:hypothetical protein